MVRIGILAMLLMFLSACQGIGGESQACKKEKAKAILWIDRTGNESLMKYSSCRTVKVRAQVYSDGTFRIKSFCKRQEPEVVEYLKKRVAVFTIHKFFFEEGYLEPGEQYLQLRYIPAKVEKRG